MNAQELTLEECQQQARAHYPLIKRYGLIEKTKEYNISNADKGYLPQVSLSAKASYQSDVTEIPVDLPGIDIRGMRKDQYQAMLQLDQVVWDGGNIRARKEVTRATSEVDKQIGLMPRRKVVRMNNLSSWHQSYLFECTGSHAGRVSAASPGTLSAD